MNNNHKLDRQIPGRLRSLLACSVFALGLGMLLVVVGAALQPDSAVAQTGPSGVSCNASLGSGGLAPGEYNVTVAGRPALIYVGSGYSASQPAILAFYLHGDGAGDQPFMSQARRNLLDDNGWIYVAPRAQGDVWYSTGVSSDPSGNAGIEANAQLLENVFEAMFDNYNLCRNVLLGSSASGGSWFYDAYFLATRGDRYPAYMNLGCGSSGIDAGWTGFPFYSNLLSFNTDPSILARTKLHYSIGTADFLFANAQDAIPHLQSLGFDVTTDFRTNVAHCAYDVDATAVNWWAELCSSGFVPVTSLDASGSIRPESCNAGQVTGPSCGGLAVTVDLNAGMQPSSGDDVILGTPGDDVIDAGAGNDVVCAEGGDDTVIGGDGADTIFGGLGIDVLRGGPGMDTIHGQEGADRLLGGIGRDTIFGGEGNDYIGGFGGADLIDGGSGSDRIFGGFGADNIDGGSGADTINGLIGDDTINGGDGADTINGDAGNDTLRGGSGDDVIRGGNAADEIFGDDGNDTLSGGKADDALDGGDGSDSCSGNQHFVADSAVRCERTFGLP